MAETQELSRDAYERLERELEDLTTRGRVDIARKIEAARELGDLSENGDYHAAKEEQGKMEARIAHLQSLLTNAVVVDAAESDGTVRSGTVVGVRFEGDDEVERYLVGSIEERRPDLDVVSPGSPLGQALIGKTVGELAEYETPAGTTLRVEVVSVE